MGSGRGHYNARHKTLLNWLGDGSVQTVETGGVFTIDPLEIDTQQPQALKIRRGVGNGAWFWVESRQPLGDYDDIFDPSLYSGALIHYEDEATRALYGLHTHLLDFTPQSQSEAWREFRDAALQEGETWKDPYSDLLLSVLSASPDGLTIGVEYEEICALVSPRNVAHSPSPETGTVHVTAPDDCSWSARSNDAWIRITSGSSGIGSGELTYQVDENEGPDPRKGTITLERQTVTITQGAKRFRPSFVSLSPASSSGFSQTLSVRIDDGNGFEDIGNVFLTIYSNTGFCNAWYSRFFNRVSGEIKTTFHLSSGSQFAGSIDVGDPGLLETDVCSLDGSRSNAWGSGDRLEVMFGMSFAPELEGLATIYVQALDNARLTTGFIPRGTWRVGEALQVAPTIPRFPLSPSSGEGLQTNFSFSFQDEDGFADISNTYIEFRSDDGPAFCGLNYWSGGRTLGLQSTNSDLQTGTIGAGDLLENESCILDPRTSSVQGFGSRLTVILALAFKQDFEGAKTIYARAEDASKLRSERQMVGTWMVGPTTKVPPAVVSVTPWTGGGDQQTFAIVASDPNGAEDLSSLFLSFRSVDASGVCSVSWSSFQDQFRLFGGNTFSDWTPLANEGVLETETCSLNLGGASVSTVGSALQMTLPITFKSGFEGVKEIQLNISDKTGLSSQLRSRGSWVVGSDHAAPTIAAIVNAASSQQTYSVSPGEIITIFGPNLGPADLVLAKVEGDYLVTQLEDTRVLFDGIPAPLVFVWEDIVSAIVPYDVAGKGFTGVQVENRGLLSERRFTGVVDTKPGLFTLATIGGGPAVAFNEDGSVNTPANPAKAGSTVVLWATGAGQTTPPGINGKLAGGTPPAPLAPVSVLIDGRYAEILYSGVSTSFKLPPWVVVSALQTRRCHDVTAELLARKVVGRETAVPGADAVCSSHGAATLIAGLFKLNVRVPRDVAPRDAVPVLLNIGSQTSQPGVTLAVQ